MLWMRTVSCGQLDLAPGAADGQPLFAPVELERSSRLKVSGT